MNSLLYDPAPSAMATASFCAVVVVVVAMIVTAVGSVSDDTAVNAARRRKAALLLLTWLAVTGGAAASGVLSNFNMPPPIMVMVALTTVATTSFAFSRFGGLLAGSLPLAALLGFQAFRLPLELVLHQLSVDRVLPVQMTYYGMNYDIVSGISAIVMAAWAAYGRVPRVVLFLWNVLALKLLLIIVTIAILSTPVPFRLFMNDPANTIVTTLPFVWLPVVLVQAAWVGHLLLFRRIFRKN